MRMSGALVNGNEAETHGHKQNHSDMVSSTFESTKMKNVAPPASDFDKSPSSRVSQMEEGNNGEMSFMKELVLIHLDLIQQQAEQLSKKDKVIEDLRNENEMLKQRLTRMERRVSLQKTKNDKKQQSVTESTESTRKRRTTEPASFPATGRKSTGGEGSSKRVRGDKKDVVKIIKDPDENENIPPIDLSAKLTTNVPYYTGVGDEQKCQIDHHSRPKYKVNLEVPQWRVKCIPCAYSMEGTEDHSDTAFDRRHHKLTLDEKKRKRWDVQRIREQRNIEKLRSREGGGKPQDQPMNKSLWPQPSGALRLAVTPIIPVSVFGINLPNVTVRDFTLPWKEGTKSRRRTRR